MGKTKNKIIGAAIGLFNDEGFSKVTIQRISESLNISLGNFTYHFPKKDDLIITIHNQILRELFDQIKTYSREPDFSQINNQIQAYYEFQKKYRFFYRDTFAILAAFPVLIDKHRKMIESIIDNIRASILYNVEREMLSPHSLGNNVNAIAQVIWMIGAFWMTQNDVRGTRSKTSTQDLSSAMWLILKPHFTEKGKNAFEQLSDNGVKI